jgi:hypothetical protein
MTSALLDRGSALLQYSHEYWTCTYFIQPGQDFFSVPSFSRYMRLFYAILLGTTELQVFYTTMI